jgi:hypothetical protein
MRSKEDASPGDDGSELAETWAGRSEAPEIKDGTAFNGKEKVGNQGCVAKKDRCSPHLKS